MANKNLNVAVSSSLLIRFKTEAGKRGLKLYAAIAQAIELWLRQAA